MASDSDSWTTDESGDPDALLLLPVPETIPRQGDKLCDICTALNLDANRFVVLPGDPEENDWNRADELNIHLGKVEEIQGKTNCPLCRLVLVAISGKDIPTHENGEPLTVSMSWNTNGPTPDPTQPWNRRPEVRVLRPYLRTQSGGYPEMRFNLFPEITLLANDSPTDSTTYFIRPYDQEKIDFAVARRWLALCNQNHGKTCRTNRILKELKRSHPTEEVPDFRCIDVENKCVARVPPRKRYAALSYVWGAAIHFSALTSNIAALEKGGSLEDPEFKDKIPLTIRDAITVAKEVGIEYLWVDNLCIIQNDDKLKTATIKAMDLVYSAADLVIVTAGSDNAHAGIAGLHPGTREYRQPIEEIAPGFRLAFRTRWADSVEGRSYNKRGWTYQETHFANRSLIFIDGKVVFRCQGVDAWEEHLIEAPDEIKGQQTRRYGGFEGGDIGEFEGLIQNYSERILSFDKDVYNAFAGVSRQLTVQLDTELCHGLPTRYFDWFLLWRPLSLQSRRLSKDEPTILAPSWSWSGWVGTSWPHMWDWYNRSIGDIKKAIRKRTWIIWYQRDGHDSTSCRRLIRHKSDTHSGTKANRNFYGSRVRERFNLDCSKVEPSKILLESLNPPKYVEDILSNFSGSGYLQFWTVSVTLRLDAAHSIDEERGPVDKRHRLGILGRSGRELGIIRVQPDWLQNNVLPQEREFILICEGRDTRAENGRKDHENGWRYMAMLLEWVGNGNLRTALGSINSSDGPMYAERVAIGSIGKHDVEEALGDGLVWKEIILG
ncbi:HET-domain-containing protein [Aaosphaeria arxii CBS 175.79]|uniref:HET-domain-containing protein n=1 Tax=Aaosphaeria arxii CBS 175.79 TaxID=1450172 RepID=A0A6A5XI32_9PLEO|nr:HET-domain-containing protein [Aaosphaeria arxii CBS 175.79]KAF2012898.1 HET-domain-containing protein [Aaosphaeria arxii CBS 175.79]